MPNQRVYVPVGIRDLARILGVSEQTARRRAAETPGAVKVGARWHVPVTPRQYAKVRGVSERTARRRGVRADNPSALQQRITEAVPGPKRPRTDRAAIALAYAATLQQAGTNKPVDLNTIESRLSHGTDAQVRKLDRELLTATDALRDEVMFEEWLGDDDYSILYYH